MTDLFDDFSRGLESPATRLQEVIPNDTTDLPYVTRALNVATGGSVRVTTKDNDTASVTVAAGIPFPLRVKRIWSTGTTATGLVAMF